MKLLISVINWNNSSATNTCLDGLLSAEVQNGFDVLLIDNASSEKLELSQKIIKGFSGRLTTINNSKNLGFSGGHNQAAKIAIKKNYDCLILINNDTEIIDKKVFQKLVDALADNPPATLAAPTIFQSIKPTQIWYGGGTLQRSIANVHHNNVGAASSPSGMRNTTFATGCCLAVRVSNLQQLGGLFSEDYFLYWEDADLSARVLRAKHKILYVPDAALLHNVSSSLGVRSKTYAYYNIRNKYIFMKRNTPKFFWPLALIHTSLLCTKYIGITILRSPQKKSDFLNIVRASFDGLRGKVGVAKLS